MKKKIIPMLAASLMLLAGCGNEPVEKENFPIDIRLDDNIVIEYRVGDEFVAPSVYSVFAQNLNLEDVKVESVNFVGYDMTQVGKQKVNASIITKDENGNEKKLTQSFYIYVYGYDEMPTKFDKAEDCFKDTLRLIYDLNEDTKVTNFEYVEDGDDHLNIFGSASLEGTTFNDALNGFVQELNKAFIPTSYIEVGVLENGQAGYYVTYIDKDKNYDIEFTFTNKDEKLNYDVNFYVTNKLDLWPKYSIETVVSWITENEETVPELTGDVYGFNVSNFSEYGIAIFNTYTQEDPTTAYEAKLTAAEYTLIELPEKYTFFFDNIAVSKDNELAMEYGYENGLFSIVLFKAQDYTFNQAKANELVTVLKPQSTTAIPALDGAYIYTYYPQLVEIATTTAFRGYNLEENLPDMLDAYKAKLVAANWEAVNTEPDTYGGYSFIAPNRDIKLNVKINAEENAIEGIVYKYKDGAEWPANEIKDVLTVTTTEVVPEYEGVATTYEVFNDWGTGIVIYTADPKAAKNAYIAQLEALGYVYSEEETANHWGDATYLSPEGQLYLSVYSYDDATFTIDFTCNVPNPGEYGLAQFLKKYNLYDAKAEAFIEATTGKYTQWDNYTQRVNSYPYDVFDATLDGDFREAIEAYANAINAEWYEDEDMWFSQTYELEVMCSYDETANTTALKVRY